MLYCRRDTPIETRQYDVVADATVSATLSGAETPEDAMSEFWDGANDTEQFATETVRGMTIDVVMNRDSTEAIDDRAGYAVEVEATVQTDQAAPNAGSAVEQFQQNMGNSRYFEIELIGGIVVTVDTDINDAEATRTGEE
jgi:hypothetical protein